MPSISSILLSALAVAAPILAVDTPVNATLNAELITAPTELNKLALVRDDYTFDFTQSEKYSYSPGGVVNANAATFPASTGHGLTIAWLALGPCAMLPPHFHPRADNFVVAVDGNTTTYMVQENGAKVVTSDLTRGKMTIFPRGSVHSMQNNGMLDISFLTEDL
jgi:oxalate decarboxylase/phosphoglucose isomerase-like protein (cupin superfamily)